MLFEGALPGPKGSCRTGPPPFYGRQLDHLYVEGASQERKGGNKVTTYGQGHRNWGSTTGSDGWRVM